MRLAGACAVALLAAIVFACSAVLQQRSARAVPKEKSLTLGLFAALWSNRCWLAGVGAMLAAYGLQVLALALGPVALVEPLVATELVFAVPVAVRLAGQRPGAREWAGMVMGAGGVGAFLVGADPARGLGHATSTHWLIGALPWAMAVVALLAGARGPETPRRAGLLAAAAGVTFGLFSLVTKAALGQFAHHGLAGVSTSWEPEALVVLGLGGFLIGQSAYQAAPLASSLPIMDATEPISAVLLAAYVLHEHLSLSPSSLTLEAAGAVAAVIGIFLLGRSPLVHALYASTEREKQRRAKALASGETRARPASLVR